MIFFTSDSQIFQVTDLLAGKKKKNAHLFGMFKTEILQRFEDTSSNPISCSQIIQSYYSPDNLFSQYNRTAITSWQA